MTALGTHRAPRPGIRPRGAHHRRLHPALRVLIAAAVVMAAAGAFEGSTHIRRLQQDPHCLASRNCQCREFGEFRGRDRCPELGTAAGGGQR